MSTKRRTALADLNWRSANSVSSELILFQSQLDLELHPTFGRWCTSHHVQQKVSQDLLNSGLITIYVNYFDFFRNIPNQLQTSFSQMNHHLANNIVYNTTKQKFTFFECQRPVTRRKLVNTQYISAKAQQYLAKLAALLSCEQFSC